MPSGSTKDIDLIKNVIASGGPTTTGEPMGLLKGTLPSNYIRHAQPNPDLMPGRTVMYAAAGNQPNVYVIRRNEGGQSLPAPIDPRSSGAVGWAVVIKMSETQIFKTNVSYHAGGAQGGNAPGPWDYFGFIPDPPALMGNGTYIFAFAPTAPTGGRRRGSKRRCRKGRKARKGTRRH